MLGRIGIIFRRLDLGCSDESSFVYIAAKLVTAYGTEGNATARGSLLHCPAGCAYVLTSEVTSVHFVHVDLIRKELHQQLLQLICSIYVLVLDCMG